MYYILDENIGLRSWQYVPYGFYKRDSNTASGFNEDQYQILLKCDGKTDIKESKEVKKLEEYGYIHKCKLGEKSLNEWQKHITYDNRYIPYINLQITGKCNYNCKHCFNCKDNIQLQSEFSLEDINKFLDEAKDCGVNAFCITGGEPMLHPHFLEIISGIYDRDMTVFELNTNGYYISQKILDYFLEIGCNPQIKISFDTIKYHDWMRCKKDSVNKTLDAIKLCIKNDFDVRVQMNANKITKDSIFESLLLLDDIGVDHTRLILTAESPRWLQNAPGMTLDINEYYDFCFDLIKRYSKVAKNMELEIWGFANFHPEDNHLYLQPVKYESAECFNLREPICRGSRWMLAVGANGNVYPCMQLSGLIDSLNISFGNVIKDGLKALLQDDSCIMKQICLTTQDRLDSGSACANCEFLKICGGGYPCMSITKNNGKMSDYLEADKTKCVFFKDGYYKKLLDLQKSLRDSRNQLIN